MAVCLAGAQHLAVFGTSYRATQGTGWPRWLRFQAVLVAATAGQCLAGLIFAFAFQVSHNLGLGEFQKVGMPSFLELYGFSMVNLTTLGLGDLIPVGPLKFLAAVEAMSGFLLISCSASHIFQIMRASDD